MGSPTRAPGIVPRGPGPSLLTAAARLPQGIDWRDGISFRQTHCFAAGRWGQCPGVNDEKASPSGGGLASFFPFTGYVSAQCDNVLPTNEAGEFAPEVRAQLDAASAWELSRELWTGETNADGADASPGLQRPFPGETDEFEPSHILNGGVAANPIDAIGQLLETYANATEVGGAVLHIPLALIPLLVQNGTISLNGQVMTVGGIATVAPGPGYPTEGTTGPRTAADPDGTEAADGHMWLYVTGPVEYDMAPVVLEPEQADARWFDRRTNQYYVVAERRMIYRFDPCAVWAILV